MFVFILKLLLLVFLKVLIMNCLFSVFDWFLCVLLKVLLSVNGNVNCFMRWLFGLSRLVLVLCVCCVSMVVLVFCCCSWFSCWLNWLRLILILFRFCVVILFLLRIVLMLSLVLVVIVGCGVLLRVIWLVVFGLRLVWYGWVKCLFVFCVRMMVVGWWMVVSIIVLVVFFLIGLICMFSVMILVLMWLWWFVLISLVCVRVMIGMVLVSVLLVVVCCCLRMLRWRKRILLILLVVLSIRLCFISWFCLWCWLVLVVLFCVMLLLRCVGGFVFIVMVMFCELVRIFRCSRWLGVLLCVFMLLRWLFCVLLKWFSVFIWCVL